MQNPNTPPRPTLTNNADGTFTFNDGLGNATTVSVNNSTMTDNANGTYTHNDGNGNTTIIDIPSNETLTSIAYDAGTNTLAYLDENGVSTSLPLTGAVDADWHTTTGNVPYNITDNIHTQGNVGIGIATPNEALHIENGGIEIRNTSGGNSPFLSLTGDQFANRSWSITVADTGGPEDGELKLDVNGAPITPLNLTPAGEMRIEAYPQTRDDSGITPPQNVLYTDTNGTVQSAPLSAIQGTETTSILVDNGDGTFTYTDETATSTTVDYKDHDHYAQGTGNPPSNINQVVESENGFNYHGTGNNDRIADNGNWEKCYYDANHGGAFRSGIFQGTQAHQANTGYGSWAGGYNATASGGQSLAHGVNTTATADQATALGNSTTASGTQSLSHGFGTTAAGNQSVALGFNGTASADQAIAIGNTTTASGAQALAGGANTSATANQALAFGAGNAATGDQCIAFGQNNTASGVQSFSTGNDNISSGTQSFTAGAENESAGDQSVAFGQQCTANGRQTFVHGFGQTVNADRSFVIGQTARTVTADDHILLLDKTIGLRDETPTSKVGISGSVSHSVRVETTSLTVNDEDYTIITNFAATGSVTLPDAATCEGRIYKIKRAGAQCDITPTAGTIDGGATLSLTTPNEWAVVQAASGSWYRVG